MLNAVAEAHEARAFHRRVDIEAPGQKRRLIRDDADRPAVHAREADHDVLRVVLVDFEELAVVHHAADHVLDVVGQVRLRRHDRVERCVLAIDRDRWTRARGGSSRLFCGR